MRLRGIWLAVAVPLAPFAASAAQPSEVSVAITLKNHRFTPSTLTVPPGAKVRVTLTNQDPATEEFDSHDLKVEELVTPKGQVKFTIGPLNPGAYNFMGEFHPDTAQGRITVASTQS